MIKQVTRKIKQTGLNIAKRVISIPIRFGRTTYNKFIAKLAMHSSAENGHRIARNCHNLLLKAGHPVLGYKICLITEAHCLRELRRQQETRSIWGSIQLPIANQLAFFLQAQILHSLQVFKQRIKASLPHFQSVLTGKARKHGLPFAPSVHVAGLYEGLTLRYITSKKHEREPIDTRSPTKDETYFDQVTTQSKQLLNTLDTIRQEASKRTTVTEENQGKIGILISCYQPEKHIKGFLSNLLQLENPQRLVPIVINAGMNLSSRKLILEAFEEGNFHDTLFIDKPNCGIYDAWNTGIKAMGENVSYLTNFNVDDRRHPLCLEIQASVLDTFRQRKVSITDYLYFFHAFEDIRRIYEMNEGNSTHLPIANKRTLVYKNLPHSSPLWRTSLHSQGDCGLFDDDYKSAGDADFWYRVSRAHNEAFEVTSLPLSLYFQNPEGLSTKPNTVGMAEHHTCSRIHYMKLIEEIDDTISTEFTEQHLQVTDPEHVQLYAAISKIKHP